MAMSGGVDSSVAITKLHEEGYETIGITLKLWETTDSITKRNTTNYFVEAVVFPLISINSDLICDDYTGLNDDDCIDQIEGEYCNDANNVCIIDNEQIINNI